jgi:cell division protein FtsI (penicillin-binding protein 3)
MQSVQRIRLSLVVSLIAFLSAGIGARIYQLQVLQHDSFRERAAVQHERRIVVPATRGAILDRNGVALATSVETRSLFAHPRRVQDKEAAARSLAPVLGVSRAGLLRKLRSDKPFVYLARMLEPEHVEGVKALGLEIGEAEPFGLLPESKRYYPHGKSAVHVVGFANIDGTGIEGIEAQFDFELQGDATVYVVQQDARNEGLKRPIRTPDKSPRDVVLSIDLVLQHIAERELDRAVRETGAKAGSVVLLQPGTGQIIALANWPAADPNHFGKASDAERTNRALVHVYEPGSTFKIVPLAAALERRTVRVDQRFFCERGQMRVGGRRIKDDTPHGSLSLREILAKSSNIGMVKVTRTLKPEELYAAIESFGFGSETGIELPGESQGILHPVSRWSDYSPASLAFGQEIGVTVLQMASALSTIANDGVLIPPRAVLGTRGADGRIAGLPQATPRRVISSRTAELLRSIMESVIRNGTGRRAAVAGYQVAGKTGTAQKAVNGTYSESEYMASFGGFAPASDPQLVALVVLDSPRGKWIHGGQVAAPVFARIVDDALRHLRIPPDAEPPMRLDPKSTAWNDRLDARRSALLAARLQRGVVPDLRGLGAREAISRLAANGYRAQLLGSGFVRAQEPAAGTLLAAGSPCRLRLAPSAQPGGRN